MRGYDNDQPITGAANAPDRLNRESFAKHLAKILVLKPKDDCLTISLESEWGYGKTSVINLLKKYCKKDSRKPVIVEYNPWLAGKAEALIQDFLVQFSLQLNIPDRPKEVFKAAKELLAYSKLFNAMKFVPGAEPWASTVESVLNVASGAAKDISKLKELDLLGRKEKVKSVLTELNRPIIVIIDDIDRLTPDEAFQVVRLVKAVADFPGTSFVLAFDPEYLIGALEKHGINKSNQYIDKVVQLRMPLPLITHRDMQELANIEFEKLSDKSLTDYFEEDKERLKSLYHDHVKYVIRTPRELKKLFNHLRFVLLQTEGEVSFTDLYALSLLVIKAPSVYQHIKANPAAYVGKNFDDKLTIETAEEVVGKYEKERESSLEACSDNDRGHIAEIVKTLFPLVGGNEHSSKESEYDKLGRIGSFKRLYIALHYQVPAGYAADTEVVAFINNDINRIDYLQRSIDEDFVERFFELLSHNTDKVAKQNIFGVLKAIFEVYLPSKYLQQHGESVVGLFGFELFRDIRWITFNLINKSEDKVQLITELISTKEYVYITADIIWKLLVQNGEVEATELSEKEVQWLDKESYNKVKATWVDIAIKLIQEEEILRPPFASHVYFILKDADMQKTKNLLTETLKQEAGVEKIAKLIGWSGSDSINGPYSQISEKNFEEVVDFTDLKNAARRELDSGKELTPYLRAVYQSITTGEKFYLRDVTKGDKILGS